MKERIIVVTEEWDGWGGESKEFWEKTVRECEKYRTGKKKPLTPPVGKGYCY